VARKDCARSVRRRERHRNDEISGGKAEQCENEKLAGPLGEEALEHGNTALAVGAGLGDARVEGKGRKECDKDQDEGGERGEKASREEGNAGLVPEGGKVIDAGEAHDGPPGVNGFPGAMNAFGELEVCQEPVG
jgi:hypothetical protein